MATSGTAVTWALPGGCITAPVCVPTTWGLTQVLPRVKFSETPATVETQPRVEEYGPRLGATRANEMTAFALSSEDSRARFGAIPKNYGAQMYVGFTENSFPDQRQSRDRSR